MVALAGALFNALSGSGWGRALLLRQPALFTLGAFSDEGPSEERLAATSWKSVFFGRGWSEQSNCHSSGHAFRCASALLGCASAVPQLCLSCAQLSTAEHS